MQTKEQTLEFPLDDFPKEWIEIITPFTRRLFNQDAVEFARDLAGYAPCEVNYWLFRALEVETGGDSKILSSFKEKYPKRYNALDVSLNQTFWLIGFIKDQYDKYPFKELPLVWQDKIFDSWYEARCKRFSFDGVSEYKSKDPFNPDFPYPAIEYYLKKIYNNSLNKEEILGEFYRKYPKGIHKTFMDVVKYIPGFGVYAQDYVPPVKKSSLYPLNLMKPEWVEIMREHFSRHNKDRTLDEFVCDMNAYDSELCLKLVFHKFLWDLNYEDNVFENIKEFTEKFIPTPFLLSKPAKLFYNLLKPFGFKPKVYPLNELPLEWALAVNNDYTFRDRQNFWEYHHKSSPSDKIESCCGSMTCFTLKREKEDQVTQWFVKTYPFMKGYVKAYYK